MEYEDKASRIERVNRAKSKKDRRKSNRQYSFDRETREQLQKADAFLRESNNRRAWYKQDED